MVSDDYDYITEKLIEFSTIVTYCVLTVAKTSEQDTRTRYKTLESRANTLRHFIRIYSSANNEIDFIESSIKFTCVVS